MPTFNAMLRDTTLDFDVESLPKLSMDRVLTLDTAKGWTISFARYRAKQISTGLFVYWESTVADPTGAHSGIAVADLSDVVKLGDRP